MMVNGNKELKKGTEYGKESKVNHILDSGKIVKLMDMVFTLGGMGTSMKVSGKHV